MNRILFLVALSCLVAFNSIGQSHSILDQRISLTLEEVTMKKALRAIEKVSGVKFVYSRNRLDLDEKISIEVTNEKLGEVLAKLFDPRMVKHTLQPFNDYVVLSQPKYNDYNEQDNVLLKDNKALVVKITGTVKDSYGETLPGVNAILKGTSTGTSTDAKGNYTIEVHQKDVLVFSYVGMIRQEIQVGGDSVINVILKDDAHSLAQVVVNAGYWQVKKQEATGNIIKVEEADIQKQPVTNSIQALIGRLPGIYMQQTTGVPGAAFRIFMRGRNDLPSSQTNIPLYIVDGVPFTSSSLSLGIGEQIIANGTSPLNNINTADIESIEILKDADATAIYGSRGANGVILVTTKKGKPGKTVAEFNTYQGISTVTNRLDLLNAKQWLMMRKEAFKNDNATPGILDYDLNGTWDTTRNAKWQDILRSNLVHSANMYASLTGGNSSTSFVITAGHYKESSPFIGNEFKYQRGSAHINLRHVWNDRLYADFTSGYYFDKNVLPRNDLTKQSLALSPVAPRIYNTDGSLNWSSDTWVNPLFYARQVYTSRTSDLLSNLSLNYKLNKAWTMTLRTGFTKLNMNELAILPNAALNPAWQLTGESETGNSELQTLIVEPYTTYTKEISRGSVINITLGGTLQKINETGIVIHADGYTNDRDLTDLSKATNITARENRDSTSTYNSFFGRINYQLKERYYLNLTARRDGQYFPDHNYGAVGVGWIFSKENFSLPEILTFGKLRVSYGYSGWSELGADKFEVATDLAFLNNRIQVYVTWYHNVSDYKHQTNQVVIRNTGWEVELNTLNINADKFSWTTYANFTIPKSILINYENLADSPYTHSLAIGKSIFVLGRYHVMGLDQENGTYKLQDRNNDGELTEDDYRISPPITQQWYGGIGNEIKYKQFQLDIFFQVVKQIGLNYMSNFLNQPGSTFTNQTTWVMNRWQKPGEISETQQFSQSASLNQTYQIVAKSSDYTISDASFLRLKNASLSWNFHAKHKIYLQGQNLFTITRFKGTDPETQNDLVLAPLRTLSLGFKFIL